MHRLPRPVRLRRRLPPPLLQTGLASLQGVRGWSKGVERKGEEPGRPAGGACSLPEPRQPPRRLLSPRLAPTQARTAPGPAPAPEPGGAAAPRPPAPPSERAALTPRRPVERSGCCGFLAAARRSVWPEDWRGRKGKAGTHTLAAARAHCTLAAARPRRGASRASLAPRLRPGTCRLPAPRPAPAPAPADPPAPPAPRRRRSPGAGGKQPHPDNLQTVAQLVSTAEAPECCPGEVSFLRVPGPSSLDPPPGLGLGGSAS